MKKPQLVSHPHQAEPWVRREGEESPPMSSVRAGLRGEKQGAEGI